MIPTFLTKFPPTVEFRSDQVKFPEATPTDLWGRLNIAQQAETFTYSLLQWKMLSRPRIYVAIYSACQRQLHQFTKHGI